ncbi:MAG: PQQ-dependent sugar dehydrogenase [Acidimicrobiia bacterium]
MERSKLIRMAALGIALVAAIGTLIVVRSRNEAPTLAAHLTCDTEAVGATRFREVSAPNPAVSLTKLADVEDPTDATMRPGDEGIYVTSRIGRVLRITTSASPETVLDVGTLDRTWQGALMSLTFDPSGRYLYVNYTRDGVNHVEAHAVDGDGTVAPEAVSILAVSQPVDVHNLGAMVFGPDGNLFIASGDGGSPGELPDIRRDGQNIRTIYGGILRIDPDPVNGGYSVPQDNPFVEVEGAATELWVIGFRNPWRFSFDRETSDLWVGDVGQWCWEEVSQVPFVDAPGTNFGWSGFEGFHRGADDPPAEHRLPVYEYRRGDPEAEIAHCAVIGGFIYRGDGIPALRGAYVFADYCARQLETLRLHEDGSVEFQVLTGTDGLVQAIGTDLDGELLIVENDAVYRLGPG